MVTDYHKRLQSALCQHSQQYLSLEGQGQMLDTDVDLLISNQPTLPERFDSNRIGIYANFEKQGVLSNHNLNNLKTSQSQVNNGFGCHGDRGRHVSRSSLNNANYIRNQTGCAGVGPLQRQPNNSQGKMFKGLDQGNGLNPAGFDVNAWYETYYPKEVRTLGQDDVSSVASSK